SRAVLGRCSFCGWLRYRFLFHASASGAVAKGAAADANSPTVNTQRGTSFGRCRALSRTTNTLSVAHTLSAVQAVRDPINDRRRAATNAQAVPNTYTTPRAIVIPRSNCN